MNEEQRLELLEFLNMVRAGTPVLASDMKWIDTLISKLQEEAND